MQYDNSIALAFLKDTEITNEKYFKLLKNYKTPDSKRKDIVKELDYRLETIVNNFSIFNKQLVNILFPDIEKDLHDFCVLAVVGTEQNYVIKNNDTTYLLIDLIHIANYTHIVSQMVYILQNYLTLEIIKYLITKKYPFNSENYIDRLNYLSFTMGLSNYLAWNESCSDYVFYTSKYEPYKEQSFGLLAQALEITERSLQKKVLKSISIAQFWNQFPITAGMFYFDDIYREKGYDGILEIYKKGPYNFIQDIFNK